MNRDKALEKCVKLLAIASENSGASETEVAVATRQLNAIMRKYGISETETKINEVAVTRGRGGKEVPIQLKLLADVVVRVFGVVVINNYDNAERKLRFLGNGAAPELASYVFTILDRRLSAQAKKQKPSERDGYILGWLKGVENEILSIAEPITPENKKLRENIIKERGLVPATVKNNKGKQGNLNAYEQGHEEGQQVTLRKGVKVSKQKRLT